MYAVSIISHKDSISLSSRFYGCLDNQYIGVAFSMIGWAVVVLKKTTPHFDEPLLVLRVSEEIILTSV